MASKGTIGILTGGGDVPGLNPAIRAVTFRAIREGYDVIGIRRGWGGLVDVVRDRDADSDALTFLFDRIDVNFGTGRVIIFQPIRNQVLKQLPDLRLVPVKVWQAGDVYLRLYRLGVALEHLDQLTAQITVSTRPNSTSSSSSA